MHTPNSFKILVVLFLLIGTLGCGDSSTDPGDEEPPSIPNLSKAQPDISYFTNNGGSGSSPNFTEANQVINGFSLFTQLSSIYPVFLGPAATKEPAFKDGVWTWTYEDQVFQFFTREIRLVADTNSEIVEWTLFWSFNDGLKIVDKYKLMEGTIQDNGNQGDWIFNTPEPETAQPELAFKSGWDISDDQTQESIDITVNQVDAPNINIVYNRTDSEHKLSIFFNNSSTDDIEIFWNTDTQAGYIDLENESRRCWSSSGTLQDVDCSQVGF